MAGRDVGLEGRPDHGTFAPAHVVPGESRTARHGCNRRECFGTMREPLQLDSLLDSNVPPSLVQLLCIYYKYQMPLSRLRFECCVLIELLQALSCSTVPRSSSSPRIASLVERISQLNL